MSRLLSLVMCLAFCLDAGAMPVDLSGFTPQPGLMAGRLGDRLIVDWEGTDRLPMRMVLDIDSGTPIIRTIEFRSNNEWNILSRDLKPKFSAVTGMRRSENAYDDRGRWDAYWDAPLSIPGSITRNRYMPRKPEEIGRPDAVFNATECRVKTDGARLELTFPNVTMGIFAGNYRLTIYRGTNLIRQELIASTDKEWVAYIYQGGFTGFSTDDFGRVEWKDVQHQPQRYEFTGAVDEKPVPLVARNRVAVASGPRGSVAVFPPAARVFLCASARGQSRICLASEDQRQELLTGRKA